MPNSQSIWVKRAKALNKNREEKVSAEDLRAVVAIWGEQCFYCLKPLDFVKGNGEATFDHLVPYSRGGRNTKRNIVPACLLCNGSKDEKRVIWDRRSKKLKFVWEGVKPSELSNSYIAYSRRNS